MSLTCFRTRPLLDSPGCLRAAAPSVAPQRPRAPNFSRAIGIQPRRKTRRTLAAGIPHDPFARRRLLLRTSGAQRRLRWRSASVTGIFPVADSITPCLRPAPTSGTAASREPLCDAFTTPPRPRPAQCTRLIIAAGAFFQFAAGGICGPSRASGRPPSTRSATLHRRPLPRGSWSSELFQITLLVSARVQFTNRELHAYGGGCCDLIIKAYIASLLGQRGWRGPASPRDHRRHDASVACLRAAALRRPVLATTGHRSTRCYLRAVVRRAPRAGRLRS